MDIVTTFACWKMEIVSWRMAARKHVNKAVIVFWCYADADATLVGL
jgi:hypothetical protein